MCQFFDEKALTRDLDAMGIPCPDGAMARLDAYAGLLLEWNRAMNLTAITSPEGIAVRHFADSLSLLTVLPEQDGVRMLDVGTGAGFPAIPLKIFRPDLRLTLMDSAGKRLTFLQAVLAALDLDARLCQTRAEDAAREPDLRESFDVVTARAVAPMNLLCEYCLPYTAVGGIFAAMKGPSCGEELEQAAHALAVLGAQVRQVRKFRLSDGSARHIAVVEKVAKTPDPYPRHGSKIAKKPL